MGQIEFECPAPEAPPNRLSSGHRLTFWIARTPVSDGLCAIGLLVDDCNGVRMANQLKLHSSAQAAQLHSQFAYDFWGKSG